MSGERIVVCPVSGCKYSGAPASVAGHVSGKKDTAHDWQRLGYKGANHYKRTQAREPVSDESNTILSVLTDSHIGKASGGYGRKTWEINPIDDLKQSIDSIKEVHGASDEADVVSVDALVYTGDLFQNDREGISDTEVREVAEILDTLPRSLKPILYICGNHARTRGREVWNQFERQGLASHLGTEPFEIGDVAVYGVDFKDAEWWQSPPHLQPSEAGTRILCLHQSVEPYRTPEAAEFDLRTMIPKMSNSIEDLPEFVFLGHLHEVINDELTIGGKQIRVISSGATTNLGASKNAFTPGYGMLSVKPQSSRYIRIPDVLES